MRTALACLLPCVLGAEPIEKIWLTHQTATPTALVVNWMTDTPEDSAVDYGTTPELGHQTVGVAGKTRIHHVEIPLNGATDRYYYRVRSGGQSSAVHSFQSYPPDEIRVAVIADTGYAGNPWGEAILREKPHLLIGAGDHVPALHSGRNTRPDDTTAFADLVAGHPSLFSSTPWMPLLGNHDREIRPRGPKPPDEPVYDIEATAFREFFALPGEEWTWTFDLPAPGVRFVALDLSHTQDQGTTWQTNHPFLPGSAQFGWFEQTMKTSTHPFLIPLYNERNSTVRNFAGGEYGRLLSLGSIAITGFGYYAERAEVGRMTYYNTSVNGRGTPYKDPQSVFLRSEDNFLLLTFSKGKLKVSVRNLQGDSMDEKTFGPRTTAK